MRPLRKAIPAKYCRFWAKWMIITATETIRADVFSAAREPEVGPHPKTEGFSLAHVPAKMPFSKSVRLRFSHGMSEGRNGNGL